MKFDFKKAMILFLLLSSTGFGLTWYLGGYDPSKQRVKELEEQYKKLEQEKEAAEAKIAAWKEIYNEKDAKDKKLAIEVGKAKSDAVVAKQNAEKLANDWGPAKPDAWNKLAKKEEMIKDELKSKI
jgi:hypothetical protein